MNATSHYATGLTMLTLLNYSSVALLCAMWYHTHRHTDRQTTCTPYTPHTHYTNTHRHTQTHTPAHTHPYTPRASLNSELLHTEFPEMASTFERLIFAGTCPHQDARTHPCTHTPKPGCLVLCLLCPCPPVAWYNHETTHKQQGCPCPPLRF